MFELFKREGLRYIGIQPHGYPCVRMRLRGNPLYMALEVRGEIMKVQIKREV